jgi:hypothetical protein
LAKPSARAGSAGRWGARAQVVLTTRSAAHAGNGHTDHATATKIDQFRAGSSETAELTAARNIGDPARCDPHRPMPTPSFTVRKGRDYQAVMFSPLEAGPACSHFFAMLAPTPRRTDAAKLRRTVSQLLDLLYVVEHSMDLFQRKGDRAELERAAEGFNEMLGHVDTLGDMIAEARGNPTVAAPAPKTCLAARTHSPIAAAVAGDSPSSWRSTDASSFSRSRRSMKRRSSAGAPTAGRTPTYNKE